MANRAPPPVPEEHNKGRLVPPPPPATPSPSRSRPNSQAHPPPPAQARGAVVDSTRPKSASSANRAPPPTPSTAELEDLRHAQRVARPPTQPKHQAEIDDGGLEKKPPFVKRKLREYRNKIRECQKSKHALERAIICSIAIGLLWLTCLSLCQAIVYNFILAPSPDEVVQAAKASMDYVEAARTGYENCANRLTNECAVKVKLDLEHENVTIIEGQINNRRLIEYLYSVRDSCNAELSNSIAVLVWLQQFKNVSNPKDEFPTNVSNSDPRCLLVDEMLKGGQGGIQALGTTDRYQGQTDEEIDASASALDRRVAYDANYVNNKTAGVQQVVRAIGQNISFNGTFDNLTDATNQFLACIAPSGTYKGKVCPTTSVLAQYDQMQKRAVQRYTQIRSTVDQWKARVESIVATLNRFWNALYSNPLLRAAIDVVLVLQGLPTLSAMGLFDLFLGDFDFSAFLMNNVRVSPTPDELFAEVEARSNAYVNNIKVQSELAFNKQKELLQKQFDFNANYLLTDYNPPPVNTTEARQKWKDLSEPIVRDMAGSLNGVIAKGDNQSSKFDFDATTVNPKEFTSSYAATIQQRAWDKFYVYTGLDVQQLFDAWDRLIALALAFDYCFRVFRTFQLIKKYWRVSAISLPPADVRTDHMQSKGLSYANRNMGQRIAACIAHPFTAFITLLAMSTAIIVLLILLYLPIYNNFVSGCITNKLDCANSTKIDYDFGSGTMISRNSYSISYSYAASEGDKVTSTGIDRINAKKQVTCDRELDRSQQVMDQDDREWRFIHKSHYNLQYQSFTLRDCINVSALDAHFPTATFIATNGNASRLIDILPGGNCSYNFTALPRALFDCADIVCTKEEVLCPKVNPNNLLVNTWKASCFAEWYIHATFLGSIMVVLVYFLMNLSRMCTMRGLVRVFWRYLSDGRFSFLGTCERDGNLRYPSIVTVHGYSMKRAIRESLAKRLRWWESKSFGILLFGLTINLPWIILLAVFHETFVTNNPDNRLKDAC